MFFRSLVALGVAASSLALTITSPSSNAYWVQFTSNVINWQFGSGDPNPVDITITNSNSSLLNGAFSIVRNLDASNGSFTVTNVTLRVATGYVINFVNGTNTSHIFATSQPFEVKKSGTPPSSNANSTQSSSGSSPSATSPSSSSSASGSGSSSGAGSPTASSNRGAATSTGAAIRTNAGPFFAQGVPALIGSALMAGIAGFAMF